MIKLPSGVDINNLIDDIKIISWQAADILLYYSKLLEDSDDKKNILENNNEVESKLIIGADGRNSFLRKLANIEYRYKDYKQRTYPTKEVSIKDVAGAGDTFLAGLIFKYIQTNSIEDSLDFANKCSTQVVQKRGVSVVDKTKL